MISPTKNKLNLAFRITVNRSTGVKKLPPSDIESTGTGNLNHFEVS